MTILHHLDNNLDFQLHLNRPAISQFEYPWGHNIPQGLIHQLHK